MRQPSDCWRTAATIAMRLRAVVLAAATSCAMSSAASMSSGECVAPTPLGCFQDPFRDPAGKSHRVLGHVAATA